jgi:hypothetical protein
VGVLLGVAAVGGIAAVLLNPGLILVSIALVVQALRYTLDWMLNGKLVCRHRDHAATDCVCSNDTTTVCAIGRVVDTEAVGEDKNPIEDVDNDEAMNLVLYPFRMSDFADDPPPGQQARDVNLALATAAHKPQRDLLRTPAPPLKNANGDNIPYVGYFRTVVFSQAWGTWKAWTEVVGRDYGWFGIIGPAQQQEWGIYQKLYSHERPKLAIVPVLHCEFEGSRIGDTLAAIEFFSFGGSWCKKNWFFRALCTILQTIFAPLALLAALAAWALSSSGKIGDALEGGGTVGPKDDVIVRGRWAYDGGHEGWNEIHATRVVQKVENIPAEPGLFDDFLKRWCTRLSEVPHADPNGTRPQDANAAATYDAQARPENSWVLHPAIDGCVSGGEPRPDGGLH